MAHAQRILDQSGSAQKAGNWYEAYSNAASALMLAQKVFTVANSSTTSSTKEISQPQGVKMVPKLSAAIVTALLLTVLIIIIQDKEAKNARDISYWQSGLRHGELRPDYS